MPAMRWSQFAKTGLIPQVARGRTRAMEARGLLSESWASTPRPGSLIICSVRLGATPIVELRIPLRSAHLKPPKNERLVPHQAVESLGDGQEG